MKGLIGQAGMKTPRIEQEIEIGERFCMIGRC